MINKNELNQPERLIRIKDVITLTGISRSYIYQLHSNNLFPKSVQLVPGGTSVAWVANEIQEWVEQRIAERDGGAPNE